MIPHEMAVAHLHVHKFPISFSNQPHWLVIVFLIETTKVLAAGSDLNIGQIIFSRFSINNIF